MEISHWSILKAKHYRRELCLGDPPTPLHVSRHKSPTKPSLNYPLPKFKFYMKIDPFKP